MKSKSFIYKIKLAATIPLCNLILFGLFGSPAHAQQEIALNTPSTANTEETRFYGLVDSNAGLELKMSGPQPADAIETLEEVEVIEEPNDMWAEIRKGFSIRDLESDTVHVRESALKKNQRMVINMLERSEPYIYFIAQECQKRGLPSELALIPFVESQFNPLARSPAAAEGLWQFVPSTGRQFNLKQNKWVDQRRDVVASTRAALDYLTYLYEMHGDWHLALISYNWGEGSVLRAIKKAEEAGLEPTLQNLDLPTETRHYIPKLQALKNLIQTPERFDITLPDFPNKPFFTKIKRNSDVDLREIARLAGVELEVIRKLNAGLKQPVLYAAHTDTLLVPIAYSAKVQASLKQYQAKKSLRSHTVKRGDTLSEIADRYDVRVKDIQRLNSIGNKRALKPGMKLSIPNTPKTAEDWAS